jgi:hypothetical protein
MKINKKSKVQINKLIVTICLLALIGFPANQSNAATIGFLNTFGTFKSSSGAAVASGGVSVGFFTTKLPTAAELAAITSNPFSALSAYGYQDVRTLLDVNSAAPVMSAGGSWDFSGTGTFGGTLTVPSVPSNAPANAINANDVLSAFLAGASATTTQLWAFGFNGGTYADGFAGSTEWAATTANALGVSILTTSWLYPSSAASIKLSDLNAAGEILVGTDGSAISGGSVNNVHMALIPEPSSASLLAIGVAGLVALRVRRKS